MTAKADIEILLTRAARIRVRLSAFIRGVALEEWTWSPEDGAPSAASVIAALLADEKTLRDRFAPTADRGARRAPTAARAPETPAEAVRQLEVARAATVSVLGAATASQGDEATELVLRLVFADGAAFGEIAILQRLIDPLRASPALV